MGFSRWDFLKNMMGGVIGLTALIPSGWHVFGKNPPRSWQGATSSQPSSGKRARLRELGIKIGRLPTGPFNNITDVRGVKVGHTTKIRGSGELQVGVGPVRTGVTAILPHDGNIFKEKLAVGHYVLNGNGEMTGFVRDREAGTLETPIFLTGTANIGIVYDAALTYLVKENPEITVTEKVPVPVVAE